MPATTPSTHRNPLQTYQFRVGMLTPPTDPAASRRTFLPAEPVPGAPVPIGGEPEQYVAGVKRVSGLNLTIEAHQVWEGGNALHQYANPDRATWGPITLEQGLAISDTLEQWAGAAVRFLRTGTVDPKVPVKRNLFIDVWDPSLHDPDTAAGGTGGGGPQGIGQRIRRYLVFNAWISRFQALPQLDAMASEVALLVVELTHEGWRGEPASFGPATRSPR